MNLSTAIFLVPNAGVRAVRVTYDPDNPKNNASNRLFKTLNPDLKAGDYVVVPTGTRHGYTVVKVDEVGVRVDFNSADKWDWIVGKPINVDAHKQILAQEEAVIDKVSKAEEARMRKQIAAELGVNDDTFAGIDLTATPALSPPPPPAPADPEEL